MGLRIAVLGLGAWGETLLERWQAQGHTVVCILPGHESEVDEFHCDRELVQVAGQWVVQTL